MDAAAAALRGFTYQALGQLAGRAPALVRSVPGIADRIFHALANEPPGVRAAVQETAAAVANAYKGAKGEGSFSR